MSSNFKEKMKPEGKQNKRSGMKGKRLNIETFFLRLLLSFWGVSQKTRGFKFKSWKPSVEKIPELTQFFNFAPLPKPCDKTRVLVIQRKEKVDRLPAPYEHFFPKHVKMKEKRKEEIFSIAHYRQSSTSLCCGFLYALKSLEALGYEGFFHEDQTFDFGGFEMCGFFMEPSFSTFVRSQTVSKSVTSGKGIKGSKNRVITESVECLEVYPLQSGLQLVPHNFIRHRSSGVVFDPTLLQYSMWGPNMRKVGIFPSLSAYTQRFGNCSKVNVESADGVHEMIKNEASKIVKRAVESLKYVSCCWCGKKACKKCAGCFNSSFRTSTLFL